MTSNGPIKRLSLITTLLAALTLLLAVAHSQASESLRDRTLVIGKVSASPKKNHRNLKPIADYVVNQLNDLDLIESRVLIAKDNQQMMQFIEQGKVDWVTETIFSAAEFIEKSNARPLLLTSAHNLKSSSATLGASTMSELCRELEKLGETADFDLADQLLQRVVEAYGTNSAALSRELY